MSAPPPADLQRLREELRRLYVNATRGRWTADYGKDRDSRVFAEEHGGARLVVARPDFYSDAKLIAAMHEALPRLFRALDKTTAERSIPILGTVGDGGPVRWPLPSSGSSAA